YWHQPSVGLLSQGTPQLPTLLQPDSSALRTVCFQSQFAQPASASNSANGMRYLMRPSGPEASGSVARFPRRVAVARQVDGKDTVRRQLPGESRRQRRVIVEPMQSRVGKDEISRRRRCGGQLTVWDS